VSSFFFNTDTSRADLPQRIISLEMVPCTWTNCEKSFSPPDLATHLDDHGNDAAQRFRAPSSCVWSGCSSKAIFKSVTSYKRHLKNIHVEPLLCPVAKCTHKKPFRDQEDLDRHISVAHSEIKPYHCPYDSCDALTKTFARRDKWVKHIQETIHENDAFCPYYHCAMEQASTSEGFKDRKQISRHFSKTHARNRDESYECALGSCAKALFPSYWNESGLNTHFQKNHGLEYWLTNWVLGELQDERAVMDKHLGPYNLHHHDCKVCSFTGVEETTPADASTAA